MKSLKTNNQPDGFRIAWFIPIEALFSLFMLTIGLNFGYGLAVAVVSIPFLYLIAKLIKTKPSQINNFQDKLFTQPKIATSKIASHAKKTKLRSA